MALAKKRKIRTLFSQIQLHILNDELQRQKYLRLPADPRTSQFRTLATSTLRHGPKNREWNVKGARNTIGQIATVWLRTDQQIQNTQASLPVTRDNWWTLPEPFHREQPSLQQSDLVSPGLEQPAPQLWRRIPAAPDPVLVNSGQWCGVYLRNGWGSHRVIQQTAK